MLWNNIFFVLAMVGIAVMLGIFAWIAIDSAAQKQKHLAYH